PGSVETIRRDELACCRHWSRAFEHERKDSRYYEIVEDTILQGFEYRYFTLKDANGAVCAVQPFFILDQDLLLGISTYIGGLFTCSRSIAQRLMQVRLFMVGCAAGEGHLENADVLSLYHQSQLLASEIVTEAGKLSVSLIVLKEFPAKYRNPLRCF